MSIWNDIIEEFKDFPQELRERLRQSVLEQEEEIVQHERRESVRKATNALLEAKVPKAKIIQLLQKHWDLRQSEAEKALFIAEHRIKRD